MKYTELPSLNQFWRMLRNHDWTYNYSDDHSVWRRGESEIAEIKSVLDLGGEEYKKLYESYSQYAWRKDSTIQQPPRPPRTKEEQNKDREALANIAESLDLICSEVWSIEDEEITDATQLWKLLNPVQSIISKINDLVEQKSKSPMWDSVAYKGYKRLKEELGS